ncbi:phosphotransferase [Hydrogenophaga sp.]|uniref:phosphotransferase n=1 Tax=Hydrogenophaga sp. TaxID=1904254 RepID=UPI00272920BA|nr:phosphotransferase [Hydrogenophaga sp.]MDO8905360.1 phosphotransferase [Hydrogenophaga sp.]
MSSAFHFQPLCAHLHQALREASHPLADARLVPLPDKGLAHDHVRLVDTGVLARVPKQSQMGLAARDNLSYQCACFERASASGHTPRLHGWFAPSDHLPRGALLVEEIIGRSALLPQDLDAIADAMAAWHRLPLPAKAVRAPLLNADDPLRALVTEIETQAAHLPSAAMDASVSQAIQSQLTQLRRLCEQGERPARRLIAFDGHPGNFLVRADGSAVLVDLEKCRYSYPALDLAHATLYTSTTWDADSHAVLTPDETIGFYRRWTQAVGDTVPDAQTWHVPLRRAMWLWSVTWCAKWRVLSGQASVAGADGEDWSTECSEAALVAHVRDRVDHYLGKTVVRQMLDEFDVLERELRP